MVVPPLDAQDLPGDRQLEDIRVLLSTAQSLGTTLAPEEIARRAAREAARLLGADAALYFDVAEDRSHATALAGYRVPESWKALYPRVEVADIPPVLLEAAPDRRALWSGDVARDPRLGHPWVSRVVDAPRSLLYQAIESKGRMIGGLLVCWWRPAEEPTGPKGELVSALAQQAGLAIDSARLYRHSEERAAKLRALADLSRRIASESGPGVFDAIAQAAGRLLDARFAHVWVDDPEAQVLRARGSWDAKGVHVPMLELPRGTGIASQILNTGLGEFVADVRRDPRWVSLPATTSVRAFGGAPMIVGDRTVGVLVALMDRVCEMTEEDREGLQLLADHAAIAIDRSRLFSDLQRAYVNLQQTQAQLIQAEKLRALGEMAGGVAHDFNNLLAAILGRAQFALGKLATLEERDLRRCLKVIETAAVDGARTVRRLQEFTRTAPARQAVGVVGVVDLLEDVLELAHRRWKPEIESPESPIRFELDAMPVPPVVGDAGELRDALMNLVANAVEALPSGGVVTLRARSASGEVVLEVADNGAGMSPETQARAFEPFFTTKGPQRSGLGLSMAYGIVSRHRGRIEIRSGPEGGTAVRLSLLADSLTARRQEPAPAPAPSSQRILLIDGDAQVRSSLAGVLRAAGHDVVEADDAPVAVGLVDTIKFDLVCAAPSLPSTSGAEVLEGIARQQPGVTCMVVSATVPPPSEDADGALSPAPVFHVNDVLKVLATVSTAPESGGQRQ
jgi:signal transduction histidine kinase/CheY-like chemotaxis protein